MLNGYDAHDLFGLYYSYKDKFKFMTPFTGNI
jgi:hypothetical protein